MSLWVRRKNVDLYSGSQTGRKTQLSLCACPQRMRGGGVFKASNHNEGEISVGMICSVLWVGEKLSRCLNLRMSYHDSRKWLLCDLQLMSVARWSQSCQLFLCLFISSFRSLLYETWPWSITVGETHYGRVPCCPSVGLLWFHPVLHMGHKGIFGAVYTESSVIIISLGVEEEKRGTSGNKQNIFYIATGI